MLKTPIVILVALVVVSAVRLSYLFASYVAGGGVQRHHIESSATIFVILGLLLARLRRKKEAEGPPASRATTPLWAWIVFCALAVALYWPALFIGLLSDDFGLARRASTWDLSAVSSTLFRPIPLSLWSSLLSLGLGPVGLHVLNVVLHGANAYLSARVIGYWVPSAWWSTAGGLLVLSAPLAPEAVAWSSGIFDVAAATFVLISVLMARRYAENDVVSYTRALFIGVSLAAVLCKETAAVGPLLVLLTARSLRRGLDSAQRSLVLDIAVVVAAISLFGVIRLVAAPEPTLFHVSKYAIQRTLFAAFGGLAAPFHVDVTTAVPWLAPPAS